MPVLEKFTELLPVKLTEEELLAKGKQLAETSESIATVEDEKSASAKEFNGKLSALETLRADLARQVRSGEEYRDVKCQKELVRDDKKVRTYRTDTGVVIRERDATASELTAAPGLFDKPEPDDAGEGGEGEKLAGDAPLGLDPGPEAPEGPVGPAHEQ